MLCLCVCACSLTKKYTKDVHANGKRADESSNMQQQPFEKKRETCHARPRDVVFLKKKDYSDGDDNNRENSEKPNTHTHLHNHDQI